MTLHKLLTLFLLLPSAALATAPSAQTFEFRNFGTMIPEAGEARILHGPGPSGAIDTLYLVFNNVKTGWFMVALNTTTGVCRQYDSPGRDTNRATVCVGPGGKIYVGTCGELAASHIAGQVYVFDPQLPQQGIRSLGNPRDGEGYFFGMTAAPDGKLYMGSYGTGRLFSYDPKTEAFTDYGPVAPRQPYSFSVAPAGDSVYVGVGTGTYKAVRVNLKTAAKQDVALPPEHPDGAVQRVFLGIDGRVYVTFKQIDATAVIDGLQMELLDANAKPARPYGVHTIPDATFTYDWDARLVTRHGADGKQKALPFTYTGAAAHLFMMRAVGPNTILGSSDLPLRVFRFDLTTHQSENLGNPMPHASGEVYSIHPHSPTHIYFGAYPQADVIVYDATVPWRVDERQKAGGDSTNPLAVGRIGAKQNRPYDMLTGPDGNVYIATTPTYGAVGGAVSKLDPATNQWQVFRNCVDKHAIGCLANITGDNRLIAGGSIAFAPGYKPGELGNAQLFLWDTQQDKIVDQVSAPIDDTYYILQLESDDDGKLIGTCGRGYNQLFLFVYDPKRREFIHTADITEPTAGYIWEANIFTPPHCGKMYFTTNDHIFTIDCSTYDLEAIAPYEGANRGGAILPDPGAGNRLAYFFITESDLVAMYLE